MTTSDQSPMDRYARQTRYAPIGEEGQQRLMDASVLVCGCGALGSASAEWIVRAGVGRVRIVDRDVLELHNLQRQSLYNEADVAARLPKAVAAANHLRLINSTVSIESVVADVTHRNVAELCDGVDLVVDGTDNFETRLLLNDFCWSEETPWVYGGVIGAEGRVMPITPPASACLACLVPEAPRPGETPTCDTAGVLGPAVGVVASRQAIEAIKLLTGAVDAVAHGLTVFDLWTNRTRRLSVPRDADCRCCVRQEFDWLDGRLGSEAVYLCGRGAVQITPQESTERIDLTAMRARLAPLGEVEGNDFLIRVKLRPEPGGKQHDVTLFADGRAIIGGVEDEAEARTVWAKGLGG